MKLQDVPLIAQINKIFWIIPGMANESMLICIDSYVCENVISKEEMSHPNRHLNDQIYNQTADILLVTQLHSCK